MSPEEIFARNRQYVRPGQQDFYTRLAPDYEMAFRQWVDRNQVPFNPQQANSDYDMRGFYQALRNQNPLAASAIDPNDQRMHYPDYWKTPYHETFSGESKFAAPLAPQWNAQDQLINPYGRILFDDRNRRGGFSGVMDGGGY